MNRALLGLAFWLGLPSTALLQKYFGLAGVAAYLLGLVLALLLWPRFGRHLPWPGAAFLEKQFPWLALLTCAALLGLFALAYPITNNGRTGDRRTSGSDTDDALNLATTELLHGRYPYYPRTYLDNPITPMPGALLLAIPFVLLGNSAYQSFFWLLLWLLAMRRHWQAGRPPLLLLWLMLALSPVVVYSLVVGNDYLANSLYVLLFMLWLVRWAPRPGLNPWLKLLPAICLGIGLSSRANFLLLLPLIFATLAQLAGRPAALRSTVTTGLTFLLVTLPFYLYDPAGFSPYTPPMNWAASTTCCPTPGCSSPWPRRCWPCSWPGGSAWAQTCSSCSAAAPWSWPCRCWPAWPWPCWLMARPGSPSPSLASSPSSSGRRPVGTAQFAPGPICYKLDCMNRKYRLLSLSLSLFLLLSLLLAVACRPAAAEPTPTPPRPGPSPSPPSRPACPPAPTASPGGTTPSTTKSSCAAFTTATATA